MNIIANIIKRGQTVAVVSNNNAATDNVYEKLEDKTIVENRLINLNQRQIDVIEKEVISELSKKLIAKILE